MQYSRYKELWRVEQAFRNLKSGLEIRPMYHRNESRIRRHIMVCFLALVLESFLAYKLKEIGCKESVKDILHDVSQIKASLITVNGEDQIVRTELSGEANAAMWRLGPRRHQEYYQTAITLKNVVLRIVGKA